MNTLTQSLEEAHEEDSTLSDPEVIRNLELQEQTYKHGMVGAMDGDTKVTVIRYVRDLYSKLKFTSKRGKDFDEPDFVRSNKNVDGTINECQTVQICQHILEKIGI